MVLADSVGMSDLCSRGEVMGKRDCLQFLYLLHQQCQAKPAMQQGLASLKSKRPIRTIKSAGPSRSKFHELTFPCDLADCYCTLLSSLFVFPFAFGQMACTDACSESLCRIVWFFNDPMHVCHGTHVRGGS